MSFDKKTYLNVIKTSIKINRQIVLLSILFSIAVNGIAQNGFTFQDNKVKDKISFKLINNLVVIPVEVNGVPLTFLLDTGVSSTMMFSLSEVDSLELNNTKSIRLRGLGDGGSISALKSAHNKIKIGDVVDTNHTLFVVFDKSLSLSKRMGIPIHGIIGYDFFKNLIVKTNYNKRKLFIYNSETYDPKNCSKCQIFDLTFYNKKPYINVTNIYENDLDEHTLLIDSGSSDAIWLFDNSILDDNLGSKWFDDFLGQGLSGDIFGKRSKIPKMKIGEFELKNIKVAFPDVESLGNVKFFEERDGSIGGELLSRFTIVMDYSSRKIYLKKNNKFKEPFYYNMSGLTIKHDGVALIKNKRETYNEQDNSGIDGATNINISTTYDFFLVPKYVVSEVRKKSPAYEADIRVGDEIISVNGNKVHYFNLHEIIGLFSSKIDKKISLRVKRNEIIYRKRFILKELFE